MEKKKRTIKISWDDSEGNSQKLILKRPKSRDLIFIRREFIPFYVAAEKANKDPEALDESFADMDIRMARVLVGRLKESSTIPLDTEDDWQDLDAQDVDLLTDGILNGCDYFLVGSQKLKRG